MDYLNILLENIFDESQESKSIDSAKKLLIKNGFSEEKVDKIVRIDLRNDFPVLRNKKASKYILGTTRFVYINGDIQNMNDINSLNTIIKYISENFYEEYDKNFNGLNFDELYKKFYDKIKYSIDNKKKEISNNYYSNNEYNIISINSFNDALKFSNYTNWCITKSEVSYNNYTNGGINHFYFCLKNNFKTIPMEKSENNPLDEYGLSMIAICVNSEGDLVTCTNRWNHDCGANDLILNVNEISDIVGVNFYETFKPKNTENELLKQIEEKIKNGEKFENIFETVGPFSRGVANITMGNRSNWVTKNGEILSPEKWYDSTDPFVNGFSIVMLNRQYNYVDLDGNLLSPNEWFDNVDAFSSNGFAAVYKNNKINFINHKGKLFLKDLWVDKFFGFQKNTEVSRIYNNKKWNYVDKSGKILYPNQWFDFIDTFSDGYAIVEYNDNWNFTDTNGNLLTPNQWYDDVFEFENGLGEVSYNDMWWNIDKNGKLIANQNLNESSLPEIRKNINTNPSEKQKKCGNYKKGHIIIRGFKITIENPKGSYRKGVDSNGKEWKIKMNNDYGYFLNSVGYDGDHIDVFLGNNFDCDKIFVVDQKINGKFDESKVMLGFNTSNEAKKAYLSNYEKNWKGFDKITEVDVDTFKTWLYDGKKQRKAFSEYKNMKITENKIKKIVSESIQKIINEDKEQTKLTKILIKKLYKVASSYNSLYRDDDWRYFRLLLQDLKHVSGVENIDVNGGKYHRNKNGEMYKEYKLNIYTEFDTLIVGIVNCYLNGTEENPYETYDMVCTFYMDNNNWDS